MTTLSATTRHQRWPSNRSEVLADLDVPFGDLVRDLALPVERLTDDLGELEVAAARLGRSRQVWFYHYVADPVSSTLVRVDRGDLDLGTLADLRRALGETVAVVWRNPEAGGRVGPSPATRPMRAGSRRLGRSWRCAD